MLIKNALIFDPAGPKTGARLDILVRDDRIERIKNSIAPAAGEAVVDARGLYAFPGLVDIHAHLREPGQEHKETLETGTLSAAAGGITTVLTMPNTAPPVDDPETITQLRRRISASARVEVLVASAMTRGRLGKEPVDFRANRDAGCAAFSDDGSGIQSVSVMLDLAEAAARTGSLLIEHPELDISPVRLQESFGRFIKAAGGPPEEAESLAVMVFGGVAGMAGARIHFTHISTRKSVEAVRMLKDVYGPNITCDCTPHHLALSLEDVTDPADTRFKINPPLRSAEDRDAIEIGIRSGVIDCIATDHAPHAPEEKNRPYPEAPPGTVGFETFLPVTYDLLISRLKTTIPDWLNLVSRTPARILGIDRGLLAEGALADIVLFDPEGRTTVSIDTIRSKSKNSVFLGQTFAGRVERTFFRGRQVFPA